MVNSKIKSSTARRIAREAKERQAGVGAMLVEGATPAGSSETVSKIPGIPAVETPAAVAPKPRERAASLANQPSLRAIRRRAK